jgi:hypothetical protein
MNEKQDDGEQASDEAIDTRIESVLAEVRRLRGMLIPTEVELLHQIEEAGAAAPH